MYCCLVTGLMKHLVSFFSDKRVDHMHGDRDITVNLEMIRKYYVGIEK